MTRAINAAGRAIVEHWEGGPADLGNFEIGVFHLARDAGENRFSAMVSLASDIGLPGLSRSAVLKLHNAGDVMAAQSAFADLVYRDGTFVRAMASRRRDEAQLYGKEDP